jgi:AraC-like DNA-binding protein
MAMAFADGGSMAGSADALRKKERDGIEAAHFHLLKDLGNPPTLDSLSRIAGMNRNKLNRGFRILYGDSVFGVFRRAKLDQALRLLDQGDLNVGEIAYAAGFKSHSHLTRAFVNRFGISPKSYRKCPFNGCNPARPPACHFIGSMGLPDDPEASNLLRMIRDRQLKAHPRKCGR